SENPAAGMPPIPSGGMPFLAQAVSSGISAWPEPHGESRPRAPPAFPGAPHPGDAPRNSRPPGGQEILPTASLLSSPAATGGDDVLDGRGRDGNDPFRSQVRTFHRRLAGA